MTQSIKEFLARPDIKEYRDAHSYGELKSEDFFRDPFRNIFINHDLFYAAADGIVLYTKDVVNPEDFLDIKGKEYSLKDMLADQSYDLPALVIGIFMSYLDVHINRVPVSCYYLSRRETNQIHTHGVSMVMVENELLEDFNYEKTDLDYLVYNEKHVSMFYSTAINGRFYIVQTADRDVDVILNWGQGKFITQGDRFGQIRFGSQCDLIIPHKKGINYEFLVKPLDHVEAGVDPVLRVIRKD